MAEVPDLQGHGSSFIGCMSTVDDTLSGNDQMFDAKCLDSAANCHQGEQTSAFLVLLPVPGKW